MKKIWIIPSIVVLALPILFFKKQVAAAFNDLFYFSPCDTPIEYSIGTIDPGFKVTESELLDDAKSAANIWGNTQGKQLFRYNPEASFTINMVYDDRQELTSKISELDSDLKQKQDQIDPKIAAYKTRQAEFERKVSDLNAKINYWNEKGGAPKEEYDKLVSEQRQLQAEAAELNSLATDLGQSTKEYNSGAQRLNKTIDDYKQVLDYKPEEGLYEQEGKKRSISIFIDVHEDEFLHTLTHEMGHALGLEHVNDENSIMYPQTTMILSPSELEIANLDEICKQRTIIEVGYSKIQLILEVLRQRLEKKAS